MRFKINKKANKLNIKTFKLHYNNRASQIYTCVLCGKSVCLDDSFSNCGKRLICWECYYTKFNRDWYKVLKFMGRDY